MDRFHIIEQSRFDKICVDTTTGVQYWFHDDGTSKGITVLLDHNGNPLIAEGY